MSFGVADTDEQITSAAVRHLSKVNATLSASVSIQRTTARPDRVGNIDQSSVVEG